jgi:hypothetical protein
MNRVYSLKEEEIVTVDLNAFFILTLDFPCFLLDMRKGLR